MGMEEQVACNDVDFAALLASLAARGLRGVVAMVDGALQLPSAPVAPSWRDVRLRFPVGTITLARRPGGVAVVVFGNADEPLRAAQRQVVEALAPREG